MKNYIDREAAVTVLCDACGNAACPKGLIPRCSYYERMQKIPVADVRPVVTCKQCSLWCKDESKLKGIAPCSHWSNLEDAVYIYTNENDFCSYGISEVEE